MILLYGINNCDSCKKARQWLERQQQDYRFHDFRNDGLTQELLSSLESRLGWEKMLNRNSTSWRQLSEEDKTGLNREKACALMLGIPTLIKRPILVQGDQLLIGYQPELYQSELCPIR